MKHTKSIICFILLSGFCISFLHAQSAIPASGGNASGSGGSASYSVGQVLYYTISGTNGTVAQGVQQPYEISLITAIKNTEEINLRCIVYPNPTTRILKLVIRTKDFTDLRFQLYNMNGLRIQDKGIDNEETEIFVDNLSPSVYFLKVLSGNREIKTFKIIRY